MRYLFGPFELDLDRFSLSREGEAIELEPKVLTLLVYFVENHGRVISREELVKEVWSDDFVSDSAVSHAVYGVRRALGDDAKDPKYLRTRHGRGFEFLVAPSSADPQEAADGVSSESATGLLRSRRGWALLAGLLAGLLGFLAAGAWMVLREGAGPKPAAISSRPSRLLVLGITTSEPDPEIQLLGLGVSDYLVRDLASVAGISVTALESSGLLLEEAGSLEELGQRLEVDHLLEGSIARDDTLAGARLELRLHSIEPNGLETLNLGTFELPFLATSADLRRFEELRRVIGTEVVRLVSPALEPPPARDPSTSSVESYRLVMAAYLELTSDFCDDGRSQALLEQALELDPDYGLAYGFLAISQYNRVWACGAPGELLEAASANLERARLAGSQFAPEFESTVGTILVETGRLEDAWVHAERLIAAYPSNAVALYQSVYVLRYGGLIDEAQARFERVLEVDPFFLSRGPEGEVPNVLLYQNRLDEYLLALPKSETAYHRFYRGLAGYLVGDLELARPVLRAAFETQPANLFGRLAQALLAIVDGDRAAAIAIVSQVEQQRAVQRNLDGEMTYKEAQLFALAGEPERALASFRRAVEQGFVCTPYFRVDPALEALRGEESFVETLAIAEARRQAFSRLVERDS